MFAPYCPTCDARVLLGCGEIVSFRSDGAGLHDVVLECRCGRLVNWDDQPPARPSVGDLVETRFARRSA